MCSHDFVPVYTAIPSLDEFGYLLATAKLTLSLITTTAASQTVVTTNAITTESTDLMVIMAISPIIIFADEITIVTVKSIAREQT